MAFFVGDRIMPVATLVSPSGNPAELDPDIEAARDFLKLLDAKAETYTFVTLDDVRLKDGAKRDLRELRREFHGTLQEHADELTRLNRAGAGVFYAVNATNGRGRKLSDIRLSGPHGTSTTTPATIRRHSPSPHHS